jgi:hypothetical protein
MFEYLEIYPLFAVIRLTQEMSTPFLNIRWMLLSTNRKDSKAFAYNSYIFLIVFTICRVLMIIPYWLKLYNNVHSAAWNRITGFGHFTFFGSNVPIDLLNLYWFTLIVKGVYKLSRANKKKHLNY